MLNPRAVFTQVPSAHAGVRSPRFVRGLAAGFGTNWKAARPVAAKAAALSTLGVVITALITGGLALIGVIITSARSASAIDSKLERAQAVTDTKLDELTREVREHNNFARRVPVLEEQIKVANHRIKSLEEKGEWNHD